MDMYFLKLPINLATCPCLVVGFSEDFQLLLANVLSRHVLALGSSLHGGHTVHRVCMPTLLSLAMLLAREGSRSAIRLRVDWCRS